MTKLKDKKNVKISRRELLKKSSATAGVLATSSAFGPFVHAKEHEVLHWSWLSASDGAVWKSCVDDYNNSDFSKKNRIKCKYVQADSSQYDTKVLAALTANKQPDFGWAFYKTRLRWVKDGIVLPLRNLGKQVGLDWSDFSDYSLKETQYPTFDDDYYSVSLDMMAWQTEVNLDHVKEAGLPVDGEPNGGDELIEWAKRTTKTDSSGNITRSGIVNMGQGIQAQVTWGIVAHQMGFRRCTDDFKTAIVNEEAGIKAMHWVMDSFDVHKVSSKNVTDRYKYYGAGKGTFFWTGPWTLTGYVNKGLNFKTIYMPNIGGEQVTVGSVGPMEVYANKDEGRYEPTMHVVKWLSDNSFKWCTEGRGGSPRPSINSRPDYKTAGHPWKVRGAFHSAKGLDMATVPNSLPVYNGADFSVYGGANLVQKTLDKVWAGRKDPKDAMAELRRKFQKNLDKT